jgi:hypothetical protein
MKCPNCLEESNGGHFVAPGFGDLGFFYCVRHPDLNRKTGQLENFFVPRYAVTQ